MLLRVKAKLEKTRSVSTLLDEGLLQNLKHVPRDVYPLPAEGDDSDEGDKFKSTDFITDTIQSI